MGGVCRNIIHNKFFVLVFSLMVFFAFFTVPYNWDSMSYHIPRIVHWIQNQSVAHYATNNVRQIANPPLHEFICLDVYLLSGNRDVFLNYVQCFSFFTNAWLVFEIAKKLGCSDKFCKIGILLFCSMPIAFGEALTTQNDNLAAVFLLIFVYNLMDLLHLDHKIQECNQMYSAVCIMSSCIGLGYITKPTISIGMVFLAIILLCLCIIRHDSIVILTKYIILASVIVLLIIMPEMIRNIYTFGAVFPSGTGARQLVGTLNPKYLFINGLKNFSFNLPNIYVTNSNEILTQLVGKIAEVIGVEINDPSISEDGRIFSLGVGGTFGHDVAISSVILYTSIVCFFWCLFRRKNDCKYQSFYTYIVTALFILICMVIRWQPFVSRYMLPFLALLCPMVCFWIEDMSENAKSLLLKNSCVTVVGWLCVTGLIMLFSYHGKIAIKEGMSRPEGYFHNQRNVKDEYMTACETVKNANYELIGLCLSGGAYEYPVLYMLKHDVERIEHVLVNNDSGKYEDLLFVPDCILTSKDMGETIKIHESVYEKLMEGESINVYGIAQIE